MTSLIEPEPEGWATSFAHLVAAWDDVRYPEVPGRWEGTFSEARQAMHALRDRGDWVTGPASLLGVLGSRSSETTHSVILAWLLDPVGAHRLGRAFLQRILDEVAPQVRLRDGGRVEVETETSTLDPATGRAGSIDVVVRLTDATLVIENKIWAGETNDQLDRYAAAHEGGNVVLVFLTPGGQKPRRAVASADRWKRLSWRDDVLRILGEVAAEARQNGRPCPAAEDYAIALREEIT